MKLDPDVQRAVDRFEARQKPRMGPEEAVGRAAEILYDLATKKRATFLSLDYHSVTASAKKAAEEELQELEDITEGLLNLLEKWEKKR